MAGSGINKKPAPPAPVSVATICDTFTYLQLSRDWLSHKITLPLKLADEII